MSFDGTDDGAEGWSTPNLLALLRRLRGAPQPPGPIEQLKAATAQDARLPTRGGLFGGGYARFMADNASGPSSGGAGQPALTPITPLTVADAPGQPTERFDPSSLTPTNSISRGDAQSSPPASLTTSPEGRAFIQHWEVNPKTGQPYFDISPDALHNPTFGYGHKVEPGEQAALRAQLQALDPQGRDALIDKTFAQDLAAHEQQVKDRLGPDALRTLSQPQFDALVADSFNAGGGGALGSQMLQNIWDGEMAAAGKQFNAVWGSDATTKARTVMPGLVRRNLQEAAIFNRGDYNYQPTEQEKAVLTQAARARAIRKAR